MQILTSTHVRQNFQEVIDTVYYQEKTIIVTKKNKPRAIIVPLPKDNKQIQKILQEHVKSTSKKK